MKTRLILVMLLLVSIVSFSQTDLKKQIISFTDSTEMLIRNGRKLIVEKTITGNREEAIRTLNYLKENIDESYVILYPVEELLLSLANSNFDLFLFNAKNYHTLLEGKTMAIQVEEITNSVQRFLTDELLLIKKDLENSSISVEDKEFIQLYIQYYEGGEKTVLNKAVLSYEKKYPKTEYKLFLSDLKQYTSSGYMNFCISYGHEFINGNIADYFDNDFQTMNMEFEWFLNQLYISIFMHGSVGKLQSTQDIPVLKSDLVHLKGDDAFSLKYGVKVGKTLYSNKLINLFPYFSLGGYQMNSQQSNFENSDSTTKYKLTDSFFTGAGASCNVTLKSFYSSVSNEKIGSMFIRPNIGYDIFLAKKEISKGNSFYFSVSMGIGIGG